MRFGLVLITACIICRAERFWTKDKCSEAKKVVYGTTRGWDISDLQEGEERKRLLVNAALTLIREGTSELYETTKERCLRVKEACEIASEILKHPKIKQDKKREILFARITVLLGGETLDAEKDFASLKLGKQLFQLLRESNVRLKLGKGEYMSIIGQLNTLDFFASNQGGIAKTLLDGLEGNFRDGLTAWQREKVSVCKDLMPWGKHPEEVGFPAGYILAGICAITSTDFDSRKDILSTIFGFHDSKASPPSDEDVISAMDTKLLDFNWLRAKDPSKDHELVWIGDLKRKTHLMAGLVSADSLKKRSEFVKWRNAGIRGELHDNQDESAASLPGLVYIRSISGKFHAGKLWNDDRFALARKAAESAAKLVGARLVSNRDYLVRQSPEVVSALLDDEEGNNNFEKSKKWLHEVEKMKSSWR